MAGVIATAPVIEDFEPIQVCRYFNYYKGELKKKKNLYPHSGYVKASYGSCCLSSHCCAGVYEHFTSVHL